MSYYDGLNKEVGFIDTKTLSGSGFADYDIFNAKGGITVASGIEKILQSISAILETPIGSRLFMPTFGSNVKSLLFELNDFILADLLTYNISEALKKWEQRITVLSVSVDTTSPRVAMVYIKFKINGQDTVYTYEDSFTRGVGK